MHLDLLKPVDQIKNITVIANNLMSLPNKNIIKTSDVRKLILSNLITLS